MSSRKQPKNHAAKSLHRKSKCYFLLVLKTHIVVTHSMMVQRDTSSAATEQEEGLFTSTPSSRVVYSFQIVEGVSRFLALHSVRVVLCTPLWAFYARLHHLIGIKAVWPHETRQVHTEFSIRRAIISGAHGHIPVLSVQHIQMSLQLGSCVPPANIPVFGRLFKARQSI